MLGAQCWMLGAGYWVLDAGCCYRSFLVLERIHVPSFQPREALRDEFFLTGTQLLGCRLLTPDSRGSGGSSLLGLQLLIWGGLG